ncbi:MAG: agarase, partial [Bacteroidota bacterium]
MCQLRKNLLLISIICLPFSVFGQVVIDVNVNVSHRVGGIDSLDRKKMVKIHADAIESDWTLGNNFGDFRDLRDEFLNEMDVYLGRNTGPISWHVNQVAEDPNRPGYADPVDIANKGQAVRTSYRNRAGIHSYEGRNELIIAAQQKPFFPDGTKTSQGWAFANGTAVGEFMGRFVNDFHGGEGQPKPTYIEIMNEPLYEFVTVGDKTPEEIFTFHNEVADGLRLQVPDIPIGGYVAAFPNFEEDD